MSSRQLSTPSLPKQKPASVSKPSQSPALSTAAGTVLYTDTVPIDAKEKIMDSVYCKVADKYDSVTDVMSFYMNKVWKQWFVERMKPIPGEKLLDVAGGTCEIAKRYLTYQDEVNGDSTSTVHVVDFNKDMLRVGQHRLADTQWIKDNRVTFAQGNAEDLVDIADNSMDAYSISAGMHNLPHPEKAVQEAFRVLKPGGRFACLEYGYVDVPILGHISRWYWDNMLPAIGGWLANDRPSYERLARSVRSFPHQKQFSQAIRRAGFHLPGKGYELYQCGMMVVYIATKPLNA
ncbi:2-hexaprenyl-6-methoxy-1,4-benzoquinone methyltransferase [Coemansia guatemalensis]|uniref:2-methoxy-6-polyprenyl-1,4-benzoquinol methylase, mitochondrial n=1 Tax=Coemansia guatemalensis TaxID=2761395 RepID=A0A9W8LU03_9FUNG|nr:2-hexaprenyl-6-methoxy-1,4-benzoquinone methyltransferase [Coemansia guatemalensis]